MEISKPDFKTDYLHEELFRKYLRVLKLARTPTREEFSEDSDRCCRRCPPCRADRVPHLRNLRPQDAAGLLIVMAMTTPTAPATPVASGTGSLHEPDLCDKDHIEAGADRRRQYPQGYRYQGDRRQGDGNYRAQRAERVCPRRNTGETEPHRAARRESRACPCRD